MINVELHELFLSGKLSTFIKPEHGYIVAIMEGELNEVLDELEWWTI